VEQGSTIRVTQEEEYLESIFTDLLVSSENKISADESDDMEEEQLKKDG